MHALPPEADMSAVGGDDLEWQGFIHGSRCRWSLLPSSRYFLISWLCSAVGFRG